VSSLGAFADRRTPLAPAVRVVGVAEPMAEAAPYAGEGDARYAQLGPGRLRRHHVGIRTGALRLAAEEWSLGILRLARAPRGGVMFLVPVGGGGSPRIQSRAVAAGEVVARFGGDEVDYRSAGPARLVTVCLERTALDLHVRALLGRPLGELRLQGRLNGLRADAGALWRLAHDVSARASAVPHILRDPAFDAGLQARLVALLLAGPETASTPAPPPRGRALARKAEAWLRQNLAEPPTIAALCGALRVSPRTLHEAFRQHVGATPKAYVKTLRLNAARHDLLGGGRGKRVTDAALDWGFEHFGWFSRDYRRLFGETPSQTLLRGRAEAGQCVYAGPRGWSPPTEMAAPAVYAM
jgi:AraC family ethanolamine operon transcriptional activator